MEILVDIDEQTPSLLIYIPSNGSLILGFHFDVSRIFSYSSMSSFVTVAFAPHTTIPLMHWGYLAASIKAVIPPSLHPKREYLECPV